VKFRIAESDTSYKAWSCWECEGRTKGQTQGRCVEPRATSHCIGSDAFHRENRT